jgi:predicted TIM-barrel fold metal-dependent hydrolase
MHVFGKPERFKGAPDRTYDPRERTIQEYDAFAREEGFERNVLVQPSAYGTDNSCLIEALNVRPGSSRAVAVVSQGCDEAELERLHEAGVRGLRLNLMTPKISDVGAVRNLFQRTAERIGALGWHIETYVDLEIVEAIAPVLPGLGATVVFDHMGGIRSSKIDHARFAILLGLLAGGHCWIKLSGADIATGQNSTFSSVETFMRTFVETNCGRLVWGSDWPHLVHQSSGTGDKAPPAAFRPVQEKALLDLLWNCAGTQRNWRRILADNPRTLYQFQ